MPTILAVDDDPDVCALFTLRMSSRGYEVASCASAPEAIGLLGAHEFDAVVTDLNMRGMNGLDLCEHITSNRPDVPVIVMTAHGSIDAAVQAMRIGVCDFITKPLEFEALRMILERAIQRRNLGQEVCRLRTVDNSAAFERMLGNSSAMKTVSELIRRVAELDTSVLLTGESGTGKSLAARSLHEHGSRQRGPFVAINCAAVPEALLESELFGHTRGAFTDARADRTGLFLQATGGTLFLDEIGELPLRLQPKLLRALQERTIRAVGSDKEIACDVRLITASNRDLHAAVRSGSFREDLFYRINVIHVDLPPLRDRGNDVLVYAQQFVAHFAEAMNKAVVGVSANAAEKLVSYEWPGNIRELQNAMERAVAFTQFDHVGVEDLPEKIRRYRKSNWTAHDGSVELVPLREVEVRHILAVLKATGGNKSKAAEILGVDRRTLYRIPQLRGLLVSKTKGCA